MDPMLRVQPSPTQPAAACTLWFSLTPALLYASWIGGVSPPGPAGTSMETPAESEPAERSALKMSGLPNDAIGPVVFQVIELLGVLIASGPSLSRWCGASSVVFCVW